MFVKRKINKLKIIKIQRKIVKFRSYDFVRYIARLRRLFVFVYMGEAILTNLRRFLPY